MNLEEKVEYANGQTGILTVISNCKWWNVCLFSRKMRFAKHVVALLNFNYNCISKCDAAQQSRNSFSANIYEFIGLFFLLCIVCMRSWSASCQFNVSVCALTLHRTRNCVYAIVLMTVEITVPLTEAKRYE